MAGRPFGPWQAVATDEEAAARQAEEDEFLQLNASPLEEMQVRPKPPDLEGVAGMFGQVYWWLARESPLHPKMTQPEVDACEVYVVAMYLGVMPASEDEDEFGPMTGDFTADAARVNARRIAAAEAKARAERKAAEADTGAAG